MKRAVLIAFVIAAGVLGLATQAALLGPSLKPTQVFPRQLSLPGLAVHNPSIDLPALPTPSKRLSHDVECAILIKTQA